ncbi:MAG: type II toxin-antitoxin system VapC family toxin [Chloroflexi bacterium]|nr:type II toxin-antitoxin system VapC family toxin [Chloroflexota bacterium]MBU1660893.1 type II toxin-antitoxin system VapC family toxin [Chloroflexota bacterium]
MSIIYLDTSALLKRFIREQGSQALKEIWPSFRVVGSAVVVYAEMAAAFSKAVRQGWQSASAAQFAWDMFLEDWPRLTLVGIDTSVVQRAGKLAWEYGLRGYDAVHLAAALVWQEGMGEPITLGTFDRQLWGAAKQSVLTIWPENLEQFTLPNL